ncbi:hypothetical protein MCP_1893 [Methanocella paludicola SANAE]|uniref:Uncharacterized protein n=1 Tax=Methanocella paludicola (strain DSM 17711 / JCM 13418 / NBRC 101707 / SANAE) TaxID=304371 RepID=D1YZU3_METPS|nr:hypothetical protein [Methanocella paludicola]BAI61965.1 hypothetical protein MCP_1893 [Methanocella paludicola SANAE]
MRIEIIKSPRGRAISSGQVCPVDTKKKHWMAKITGLDEKFGLSRDFLRRSLYDTRGKAGGYSVDGLKAGDIIEEGDDSGKSGYREYARITRIDDATLEFEYMRAGDVSEYFKSKEGGQKAII